MRHWMKFGLLASVTVNLFLGGILLGSELRSPTRPLFAPAQLELIEKLASQLSTEDQAIIKANLGDMSRRVKASFVATENAKLAAAAILSQDPFDAEKFRSAVHQIDAHVQQTAGEITRGLLRTTENLSPQGRALVADLMRRAPPQPGMQPR